MVRVLFVCTGNICRSPTAEGIMRHLLASYNLEDLVEVDSAGTDSYHVGEPPDPRSQEVALKHGIDLSGQRARQIVVDDLDNFNYVIAMDDVNLQVLRSLSTPGREHGARLLTDYAPRLGLMSVPDPFYGDHGFDTVYSVINEGVRGLLDEVRQRVSSSHAS